MKLSQELKTYGTNLIFPMMILFVQQMNVIKQVVEKIFEQTIRTRGYLS